MKKIILFVYLTGNKIHFQFLKSLILRYNALPLINYQLLLKKRFIEFLRIAAFPVLLLLRLKKSKAINGLYYEMSHAPYIHNRRIKFIAKYVNKGIENDIVYFNNKVIPFQSISSLIYNIPFILFAWILALVSAICFLFAKNERFISLYSVLNGYCSLKINQNEAVIFCLFSAEVYVFSYISSRFCELSISPSNSTVFPYNRYTYLPNCNIYLCSKIQVEEVKVFQNNNWFQVKRIGFWGLEEVDIYTEAYQNNTTEKYDIGYFSSGEWARIDGLDREHNIEKIRNLEHIDNPGSVFESEILDFLINYCTREKLSLCVYLHPFERDLWHIHHIEPPFLNKLVNTNIAVDSTKGSISNVYEARIGVSPFSTSIWDRFNFDKIGFIGEVKGYEYLIDRQYLGLYNQYVFNTAQDLEVKLNAVV